MMYTTNFQSVARKASFTRWTRTAALTPLRWTGIPSYHAVNEL